MIASSCFAFPANFIRILRSAAPPLTFQAIRATQTQTRYMQQERISEITSRTTLVKYPVAPVNLPPTITNLSNPDKNTGKKGDEKENRTEKGTKKGGCIRKGQEPIIRDTNGIPDNKNDNQRKDK